MAGSKAKQSNCLVCYKLLENLSAAAGKKEMEEPLQLKVFQNYCQLLKVQSVNVKWNFRTDGFIYCPECYIEMAGLVDLSESMKKIKNSIDKIMMSTKFTILNSKPDHINKDKISGKPLRRIDYLRDLSVKEFEPQLRISKIGTENLTPSPNGYQIKEPVPKPINNKLPKSKFGDVLLSPLAIQQPDQIIIKKEKGLVSTSSTNPNSIIRIPIPTIRSSPRTQTSVTKPELKKVKNFPHKDPTTKKEWETIDLLSSDDEENDPDFLASSSEDELGSASEKSWKEESISSSVNHDGVPVRKSARTKRKSIKMIEADNDNSQVEISSSNSSNPLNKKLRLAVENNNNNSSKYKCGDCAYSSTSKKSLIKHMKILNHRRYDEMFSKDSNEENKNVESDHQDEYSNKKKVEQYPFECKICWTRHATLLKLRSHEKDHYGKKAYKCTRGNCQLSFTDTTLLEDHVKKVHANENEKCLLAFMDNCNAKEIDLDIDLSFLDDNPVRNVPSPTPEESFRIIEDDPMFRLDIDEPIIRPEENEPMGFETIDYTDATPIDYSGGHFSFFDQLSQSQPQTQGIYYL